MKNIPIAISSRTIILASSYTFHFLGIDAHQPVQQKTSCRSGQKDQCYNQDIQYHFSYFHPNHPLFFLCSLISSMHIISPMKVSTIVFSLFSSSKRCFLLSSSIISTHACIRFMVELIFSKRSTIFSMSFVSRLCMKAYPIFSFAFISSLQHQYGYYD